MTRYSSRGNFMHFEAAEDGDKGAYFRADERASFDINPINYTVTRSESDDGTCSLLVQNRDSYLD